MASAACGQSMRCRGQEADIGGETTLWMELCDNNLTGVELLWLAVDLRQQARILQMCDMWQKHSSHTEGSHNSQVLGR